MTTATTIGTKQGMTTLYPTAEDRLLDSQAALKEILSIAEDSPLSPLSKLNIIANIARWHIKGGAR